MRTTDSQYCVPQVSCEATTLKTGRFELISLEQIVKHNINLSNIKYPIFIPLEFGLSRGSKTHITDYFVSNLRCSTSKLENIRLL